jgi:hypothetical protein
MLLEHEVTEEAEEAASSPVAKRPDHLIFGILERDPCGANSSIYGTAPA